MDRDQRVQMVEQPNGHFYLFEPVQLQSGKLIVPIFFYRSGTETFAKCVRANQTFTLVNGAPRVKIEYTSVTDFDSNLLSSINVKRFWREFKNIQVNEHVLLKDACQEEMYGMLLFVEQFLELF